MDRLNSLPDDVICYILSFLPTKTSVRTSVLSKRWKCLWTLVPALEFSGKWENICKVMLQHKININTLRLDCSELYLSCYELESWIDNISSSNVHNLVLNLSFWFKLPRCLLTCKTLVYLSLIYGAVPVGCGVDLPVLKNLELYGMEIDYEESLSRLIFGCPVLEELTVDTWDSLNKVVCSPTMTKLTIMSTDLLYSEVKPYKMKLDVPALRYLRLSAPTCQTLSAGTLSSLNKADVDFRHCDGTRGVEEEKERIIICSRFVLEFLGKLSNVRCLKLKLPTGTLVISYDMFSELAPKFHKLTELELSGDCRFISIFLENANNLRLLTIDPLDVQLYRWYLYLRDPKLAPVLNWRDPKLAPVLNWRDPKQVPACLLSHLETINLVNFLWDTENDFDMIRYILRNGKVLKRVGITIPYRPFKHNRTNKNEVLDRLISFEKGLETCQVAID